MPRSADTIAALATPTGTSALAVLRASGPDAARLAVEIFGTALPARSPRRMDYRGKTGALVDDVLITTFPSANSYTGEDAFEISCHGNPFIAQTILEDLLARGCRAAGPGEFTQRAFLHGRLDLSQAEAVMDLIHARSERALEAANRLLRGELGRRLNELTEKLLGALARVLERQRDGDIDVVAAPAALLLLAAAPATGTAGRATTAALAEQPAEDVAEITELEVGEHRAGAARRPARAAAHPGAGRAERVVLLALVVVGQHFVRLLDLGKARGRGLLLVAVGVVLQHELAVRAADVRRSGGPAQTKDFVVVARRHGR
jgi:tRNA modification GTPase